MSTEFKDIEHEHKSEVQSFVEDVRKFWDRFGLTVLLLVLAVLVVILLSRFLKGREERLREEAYVALASAESPFAIEDLADRYGHVAGFPGYARIRAADMRVQEAMGLISLPGREAKITDAQRTQALKDAVGLYQQVVEQSGSTLQVLSARLGQASAYESLGEFDKAAEQYKKVQESKDWPLLAARAAARLQSLDEVKAPITFPPPKPKEEEKKDEAKAADAPKAEEAPKPADEPKPE